MAEKLMLLGVLILLVMAIGAIAEITDDIKAVRKTVSYLKEKESSVDDKFNYIRTKLNHLYGAFRNLLDFQKSIGEQVKEIHEYLEKEIEKPERVKLTFKLDDRLRKTNKLMAALVRTTLATETTVEKLAKPKIHQKWSDRK